MRLFEIPIIVMSLVGLCFLSGLEGPPAQADFVLGEPINLGPPVNSPYREFGPVLSPDGLELYFSSDRPGGYGNVDIWVTRRASLQDPWGLPTNLGPQINSSTFDNPGSMSADGLTLYCHSGWDFYTTTRATKDSPWGPRVRLGSVVVPSTSYRNGTPLVTADGLELVFLSERPSGYGGGNDIWVSTRATSADPWGTPVNLGPSVNTPAIEAPTWLSPDGLTLLLISDRPGGFGGVDMWVTTRASRGSPWGAPRNLGSSINTIDSVWIRVISPDGWCYLDDYLGPRPGGLGQEDIWQATITPVVDFNGDGKIDAADMAVLVDNWGKNNSLCDIGPFPLGDGVVDEKDLAVLLESLVTPGPKASDVPYDTILSWISPSFANLCDVYLGTSKEAVSTASRTNPQGVLISQGQTATTCEPPGLLELSQTYYWRVDFVVPGSAAPIIKGPVLEFTTAALTYRIKNITATASSAAPGSGPERSIDGSGLDKTEGHSTDQTDMWWSMAEPSHWIQYEFDRVYTLHELRVWNFNQVLEPFVGFGAKTVRIEYSTDGTTWTALADVPEFAQASGQPGYTANTIVSFGQIPAQFVKLTIENNWGVAPQTGLSEVRFFAIQSAAVSP